MLILAMLSAAAIGFLLGRFIDRFIDRFIATSRRQEH